MFTLLYSTSYEKYTVSVIRIFTARSNVFAAIKTTYELSRTANAGNIVHIDLINHVDLIVTETATLYERRNNLGKYFERNFLPSTVHTIENRELRCKTTNLFPCTKLNFFLLLGKIIVKFINSTFDEKTSCISPGKTFANLQFFSLDSASTRSHKRVNYRVSRNKSRCYRDSSWISRVENWTTSPRLVHDNTFLAFNIQ